MLLIFSFVERHSELGSESDDLDSGSEAGMTLLIAVVGTRKITQYGKDVTEMLVSGLVNSEVCIVSGLALGVDGTAHRIAVENHGTTIAVLAGFYIAFYIIRQ